LRIEVDPVHADKFKRGILLKKEKLDRGVFRYTVKLIAKENEREKEKEKIQFNINDFYFKAV
jgi:hypothetical protein